MNRKGSDAVIVAVASPQAQKDALRIVRRGGKINFFAELPAGKEIVDDIVEKFDRIDILVNNVGIHRGVAFWEEPLEYYEIQFKVNVLGIVIPSQLAVPHMMKRRKEKIINIYSKAALVGKPGHAAYSASKGAM